MKGDDNPADLFTKHLNREKMHRALQFMSCEFREGRSPAAPQRKDYEKILGEDIEWQVEDAVREEFDDDEVELRLAKECECQVNGPESGLQGMEEILAAAVVRTEGCAEQRCDYGGRTTDGLRRTDVTMVAAKLKVSTPTIQKSIPQSIHN